LFYLHFVEALHTLRAKAAAVAVAAVSQRKKKLAGEVIATKIIRIEGMHCENCKNTVEKYINQIDGASAQVNLKKNIAVVQLDRPVEDTDLRTAVARAGFTVVGIEQMET
jgi:copper chaperone